MESEGAARISQLSPRARPSILNILTVLVSVLYPVLAMIGLRWAGPLWVIGALCGLLVLKILTGLRGRSPAAPTVAAGAVILLMVGVALADQELAVRLYPALMNLAMLVTFGASLIFPPSLIERFARILEPDLPQSAVDYTRKVTAVWCLFFLVNGGIALWSAVLASIEVWAIYNGLIAYVAMGLLHAAEYLVRIQVRRRRERG